MINKFARFLRRTHIDELPQIISVLKGDLALVGIRPLAREEYDALPKDIKGIYDKLGPGLIGIHYTLKKFPPTTQEVYDEYRKFYELWKKNKAKAYWKYSKAFFSNKLRGKVPSK